MIILIPSAKKRSDKCMKEMALADSHKFFILSISVFQPEHEQEIFHPLEENLNCKMLKYLDLWLSIYTSASSQLNKCTQGGMKIFYLCGTLHEASHECERHEQIK
jgi:hypothetical protein